jgi:hypothetical protein
VVMLPQGSNVSTTTVQLPPRDHPSHILAFHHSCSCASGRRAEEQEQEHERAVGGTKRTTQLYRDLTDRRSSCRRFGANPRAIVHAM